MAYAVPEAVWLASSRRSADVFVAYPSADVGALRAVATDPELRREVTVTVDSVEHVRFLRDTLGDDVAGPRGGARRRRVAAGGPAAPRRPPLADAHPRRGPRRGAGGRRGRARRARRDVLRRPGRRAAGCRAARARCSSAARCATSAAARGGRGRRARRGRPALRQRRRDRQPAPVRRGPGRHRAGRRLRPLRPTLFDGYDDFSPAAGDGLRPAGRAPAAPRASSRPTAAATSPAGSRGGPGCRRRCGEGSRSCAPRRRARCRRPSTVRDADGLAIGDRVWMRGAKAGELLERFDTVHLVRGGELVDSVPSYRGEGRNFG